MAEFFAELKRRQMFRVAAAYAVVAWVLLQVVNNIAPALRLPDWAATLVLVLLLVGFPITLLAAWARELGPDSGGTTPLGASKLDYVLAGGLIIVIGLVSYQQLSATRTAQLPSITPTEPASQSAGLSIAVLPFVNLSDDRQQDFFSDGITEEITSALAKIPDLVVIGRTSAFQYKGRNEDLRSIGQALSASYLLEGSVRRAADRVRITAQLIRADSGAHLWTENYDRNLTDIFATQEDIAQAIAGALRIPLGLRQGENLVASRGIDPESYQQYLRAKALVRARGRQGLAEAVALLEQVVARDPGFAPAWALLALAYDVTPNSHPSWHSGAVDQLKLVVDASLPRAEIAARRAIQLDPGNADAYAALGRALVARGKFVEVEDLYKEALELDPNNPDALNLYGNLLAVVGRLKDALAIKERLQTLDPFVPVFSDNAAITLWLNGQTEAAITLLRTQGPGISRRTLARLYAATGRYNEAADALLEIPAGTFLPGTTEDAVRLLRSAPSPAPSPQALPRLGTLDFVYLHVGAPERVLEFYESNANAGFAVAIFTANLWDPAYAGIRKTDRFKALVRKNGLVEYWRARGWPESCKPVGADDIICE